MKKTLKLLPISVIATVLSVLLSLTVLPQTAAFANVTDGFNPGNIISDQEFYNGSGLDANGVQNVLNNGVSNCTIGNPGREPGAPYKTTYIAQNCLKSFYMATPSHVATQYCRYYQGSGWESAAEIIAKVGYACDVNPKVLLVMLEKEQSLITDDWPTTRQLNVAMGYGCPDDGPGYSANCDAEYYGLFNQVYLAAQQIQRYKQHPDYWRYKPGQVNTIQYHPNPDCGTSDVYIENSATAALYIYTPYRPNDAALAAGWGTGDGCSTYGNRNFYSLYKTWFGFDNSYTVNGALGVQWHNEGAQNSRYGMPTSSEYSLIPGVIGQNFENGIGMWNMYTGASFLYGDISTAYRRLINVNPGVGPAISSEMHDGQVAYQIFQNGKVYWTAQYRSHFVLFSLGAKYDALGGIHSDLGVPTSDEYVISGGWEQRFEHGVLRYYSGGRSEVVYDGILGTFLNGRFAAHWKELGRETSRYGMPVDSEYQIVPGIIAQNFEHGTAYWTAKTGSHFVYGDNDVAYRALLKTNPSIGAPTEDDHMVDSETAVQSFENGKAFWTAKTKTHFTIGQVRTAHDRVQAESGRYGIAVSDVYEIVSGIKAQDFAHGTIFYTDKIAPHFTYGDTDVAYRALLKTNSKIGAPLEDDHMVDTNTANQEFEHGTMTWTRTNRTQFKLK